MSKTAYVFPGQGSQVVGMGKDLYDNFPQAREIFARATVALGIDIKKLCFEGPAEELVKTEITQPAILTVSAAAYEVLKEKDKVPFIVAGHSLGEYSALAASGAIHFEDAVRLVHLRGRFMQQAVPEGKGAMAAILGLEAEQVEKACEEASIAGIVETANYNSPGQVVISGEKAAVEKAAEIAKQKGAKRAIMLQVSAPFHCSMMKPAAARLADELCSINVEETAIPVVSNVTADYIHTPEAIKQLLVKQVTSSVRWQESIEKMAREGATKFVEVGPGKVLTGLIKKIIPNAQTYNVEDAKSLEGVLAI